VQGHHQDRATQEELLQDKDITALAPLQVKDTKVHLLKDIQEQLLGIKDIQELVLLLDRDTGALLHLTRGTVVVVEDTVVELLHHIRVEDMGEAHQWMLRFNSGSMRWIRTGVDRSTPRNYRGPSLMATGATSARRPVG